jgi:xylose dehydrogenase (NAD/NADP)
MAERIKWGVLGNAEIARVCIIPAMQKSSNGMVYGLATRSPENARRLAAENNISRVYHRYDDLLAEPEIDAVYIPLPNHLHRTWTLRALEANKHVLCEKPFARNATEAAEMANVASAADLLLMEAMMYRFHPRNQIISDMVTHGKIGTVTLVRSSFCYPMDEEILAKGNNARLQGEMGGGALLDVGCYCVSVARWFMGMEPTAVQAQAVYHPNGVDMHLAGSLRFAENGLATIEASFISSLQQTYSVLGSEGAIELPHDAFIPWEREAVFTVRGKDQEVGQKHVMPGVDEYLLMVEHFADAVLGKETLAFTPEESVRNMRVLDSLAEAARGGQTIRL